VHHPDELVAEAASLSQVPGIELAGAQDHRQGAQEDFTPPDLRNEAFRDLS
jgi:hypothetical protein